MDKINVHEERVCERHFVDSMFVNEYHNRLHQTAIPVLHLSEEPLYASAINTQRAQNKVAKQPLMASIYYFSLYPIDPKDNIF